MFSFCKDRWTDQNEQLLIRRFFIGQNSDIISPGLDADPVAGSGSNNRINYRYLHRCSYIVLVSVPRRRGVVLGLMVLLWANMNENMLKQTI